MMPAVHRSGLRPVIDVRPGDLFGPVAGERFDLVAFNPPYLRLGPGEAAQARSVGLERSLRGSEDLAQRFAEGILDRLTPMGAALVVLSTAGDAESWLGPLRERGFKTDVLVSRDRGAERLTAYRCQHQDARAI